MAKINKEFEPLNFTQNRIPKTKPNYLINRDVLTQENVIQKTGYIAPDQNLLLFIKTFCKQLSCLQILYVLIPILKWLPMYSIKNNLIGDVIAGCTVAVMHIPQGMAYGILAGVTAEIGLYMAFFPVLMYMIFGTSKHISIGTFAVISMMTLNVVQTYASTDNSADSFTPIEVATATAITTGIIHIIMSFLRLGALASLLSEPLVNGFTTGAAVHVIVSQLDDIFGLKTPKKKGVFKLVYTIINVFTSILNSNKGAVIFSFGIIIFMIIMNEFVKPNLKKKCRFPMPAELIAVIGGTLISKYLDVAGNYGVALIGEIPVGLPLPKYPRIELFSLIFVDSISIAIVSYSIVMSMGLIFAKKHSYEISANQELLAMGIGNIFCGFWSCIPLACSLSRSLIQEQSGGVTQIASLISSLLILCVLLFLGPFFEKLPRCVLAGVITVAIKGMFMQVKDLCKFAKQGKLELMTWLATFLGVVIVDIDIGLFMGIFVSVLSIYIKGLKPYGSLVGTIFNTPTGIYVDLKNHKNAIELPQIKIFRYCGPINFATRNSFKRKLYKAIYVSCETLRRASIGMDSIENNENTKSYSILILDLSACGHIDIAGCKMFTEIMKDMKLLDVSLYLAAPSDRCYDSLIHGMALSEGPFEILPTVHDAVLYAEACRIA